MDKVEKRLRTLLHGLTPEQAENVLAFAEFLQQRGSQSAHPAPIPAPVILPRPEKESVVTAIKRLSASYPMLDRSKMLNETSMLMSQHVMQGREAAAVIDDLEALFARHYEKISKGE